jgi:hypothetical protein
LASEVILYKYPSYLGRVQQIDPKTEKIPRCNVKLPGHRPGLPGHIVASRKGANEISFLLCPLTPSIPLERDGALAGQMPKFARSDEPKVNQFQIKSKAQMS